MQVHPGSTTSVTGAEVRLTLEAVLHAHNALRADDLDPADAPATVRAILTEHEFSRAPAASHASIDRLVGRLGGLAPLLVALPGQDPAAAVASVNEELHELDIQPSVVDHGAGPHLHWTPPTATFDDQVLADVLLALAFELCENGTGRFGSCAATGCDDLFYDTTRNRSRRFCPDPRCASRTHTADHRRRRSG